MCNAYSPLVAGDFGNRNDEWGVRTDGYKVHIITIQVMMEMLLMITQLMHRVIYGWSL